MPDRCQECATVRVGHAGAAQAGRAPGPAWSAILPPRRVPIWHHSLRAEHAGAV